VGGAAVCRRIATDTHAQQIGERGGRKKQTRNWFAFMPIK